MHQYMYLFFYKKWMLYDSLHSFEILGQHLQCEKTSAWDCEDVHTCSAASVSFSPSRFPCVSVSFPAKVLLSILMCDIQVHKDLRETALFTPESPATAITFTLSDPHRNGQILRDGLFSLFPQHFSSLSSV